MANDDFRNSIIWQICVPNFLLFSTSEIFGWFFYVSRYTILVLVSSLIAILCLQTNYTTITVKTYRKSGHFHKYIIYFSAMHLFYLSSQSALTGKVLWYTVTDRNIPFSGTHVTCYLLSFGKLVINPVHFMLSEIIKRGNQGIIV